MGSDRPQMYTIPEVAELLSVEVSTVYRWIRAGKLGVVKSGSRFSRVTQQHVDDFVARFEIPADPPRGLKR